MDQLKVIQHKDHSNLFDIQFNPEAREDLGEIYTYIPKVRINQLVDNNQVLVSLETSRCMSVIRAPFKGKIILIERSFIENPCDIKDETLFIIEKRL